MDRGSHKLDNSQIYFICRDEAFSMEGNIRILIGISSSGERVCLLDMTKHELGGSQITKRFQKVGYI